MIKALSKSKKKQDALDAAIEREYQQSYDMVLSQLDEPAKTQLSAALRYVQGVRDHMLTVDWTSVRYYANLFSTKKEQNDG